MSQQYNYPFMQDTIYLHNLKTQTLIGILPHERYQKQTLIISLELETDFRAAIESDDVRKTISYSDIAEFVCTFASQSKFGLLEAFAGALLEEIFAKYPAQAITLKLQKPGAIPQTREVGLKIHRTRNE